MKPCNVIRIVTVLLSACEPPAKPGESPKPPPVARAAPVVRPLIAPSPSAPAPMAVGMLDPFGRLSGPAVKLLNGGYKAMREKKHPEAREAFHGIVVAYPDKPAARFQELRAAALEGDFAAVPAMWRELLARDFVGYAGRLDKGKEMAPLRASPQWPILQSIEVELKALHLAGLGKGFVFLARTHLPPTPKLEGDEQAKLDLDQEVYHFDPGTRRIRRLTDTGGKVVAIHREAERRQLVLMMARAVKKTSQGTAFSKPEAALLLLDTLERVGPLSIDADALGVELCFSEKGEPVWAVNAAGAAEPKALTLDATGGMLVALDEPCASGAAATIVRLTGVTHRRRDPEGVALSDDGLQVTGVDGDRPVRASRAIRPGSLAWSPGKKRFVYTGSADRCDPALLEQKEKPSNALFVWDTERKKAARVKAAPSSYETEWLDDDHLAYESGLDRTPKLTIHDFASGGSLTLKAPAGAALFGMPTLPCLEGQLQALAP